MIRSANRFHGRNSLRFVYLRGQTIRGSLVSLRFAKNTRQSTWRAAVVISRRVSKSAVVRNRVRRRVYEIIRTNSEQIVGAYDLVFTVYGEDVATMSHQALEEIVVGELNRAGITNTSIEPGNKEVL